MNCKVSVLSDMALEHFMSDAPSRTIVLLGGLTGCLYVVFVSGYY